MPTSRHAGPMACSADLARRHSMTPCLARSHFPLRRTSHPVSASFPRTGMCAAPPTAHPGRAHSPATWGHAISEVRHRRPAEAAASPGRPRCPKGGSGSTCSAVAPATKLIWSSRRSSSGAFPPSPAEAPAPAIRCRSARVGYSRPRNGSRLRLHGPDDRCGQLRR